ncbi:MAG: glycoside hydrolase family 43, partial [Armatimonadetes bacterium]|nr:glycoside hydrolase family 43 [Armatimonadota bacterium]
YGSYSGGLFILRMDETTGRPLPGQGYGKLLMGGNHAPLEGGYVLYHPQSKFYYLFVSFGGLGAASGYNMRVARSRQPDGPYLDSEGTDMVSVKADPTKPLFDDRSIEPYGVKLMGNFLFERKLGEAGTGMGTGYVSPGHNSAYYDPATGRQFLIFHTRFPGQGEGHQIRVHQMFLNDEGWPVVAPSRYAGETIGAIREEVGGAYKYINHGKAISALINTSKPIRLERDGSISGTARGNWKRTGSNGIVLTIDGQSYSGVLARGWEPQSGSYVLTFSALSKAGVAIWGRKMPDKTGAQVVADVKRALDLENTGNSIITNLTLPTEGTQGSRITWTSSNPRVISAAGVVTRPQAGAGNAEAVLTATITHGVATATKTFRLTVKEKSPGGLVAHYAFEGNLNDSIGRLGIGKVTGNRIDRSGGAIRFARGVRGEAALFDGSSGIVLPQGLIAGEEYSVALWVKPAQLTDFTTVFFGARDRDNWVTLMPRGHGVSNHDTMLWAGRATFFDASAGMKIASGEWTHLAFTVQNGSIAVYVNGKQRFKGTGFPGVFTTTTGTFGLGVNWWDAPYKGLMDEVRVYESAITAEEIAALSRHTP